MWVNVQVPAGWKQGRDHASRRAVGKKRALTSHMSKLPLTISKLDRMGVPPREIDSLEEGVWEFTRDILASFQLEEKAPPGEV